MKRTPRVIVLLLVVTAVLLTSPVAAAQASGTGNSGNSFLDITLWGIKNPLLSPCSSPAWKMIYMFVSNPGEKFDPDHCIQFFAVQAGDTLQCPNIKRGAPMTKCYVLIASKKNDPDICNQVPQTNDMQAYLKVDCLWEVAIKNNNADACRMIGNARISRMIIGEESQQTCLARLASGRGVGESTL